MYRNEDGFDDSPQPSERAMLKWAAPFAPRAKAELERLEWEEANAEEDLRREVELMEFTARVSGDPKHRRELQSLERKLAGVREARERRERRAESQSAQEAWNPNQPRVPAGSPQGGEWSKGGGWWGKPRRNQRVRSATG